MGATPGKNNIFLILSERRIYMRSYITMTTEMNDTALTTIDINDSVADNNDEQFLINTNLPNYIIKPHKKGDSSDFIDDVLEDDVETGAG